jgi:ABC-type transport system involved in cytochrome bd biosynthesis fused ATPase/permease subunit
MRDWLIANAFLVGLALVAAAMLWLSLATIRALGIDPTVERYLMAAVGVGTLYAVFVLGRFALRVLTGDKRAR